MDAQEHDGDVFNVISHIKKIKCKSNLLISLRRTENGIDLKLLLQFELNFIII